MSDFEDEMERRQQMIADKLAEIGIVVQMPVPFVKMPNGPLGGHIQFLWDDSSGVVQQAIAEDDVFAQIVQAEKEAEKEQREIARREAEAKALEDLAALADGLDDDDD